MFLIEQAIIRCAVAISSLKIIISTTPIADVKIPINNMYDLSDINACVTNPNGG